MPVTSVFVQSMIIHLKIQQRVSILTLSFGIGLDKWIFVGKLPVAMKCAQTVLPLVTLVTSTNKSVLCDVHNILDIGRNGNNI